MGRNRLKGAHQQGGVNACQLNSSLFQQELILTPSMPFRMDVDITKKIKYKHDVLLKILPK